MKTNSLLAYYKGEFTGRFSEKRFAVLDYITKHPNRSRQDIAEDKGLGQPINCVCGRVKELLDAGLIREIEAAPRSLLVSNFEAVSA